MTPRFDGIRVIVADDHPAMRTGIRTLLEADERISVVAEAADGAEALALTRRFEPHVLLLDMEMPRLSGIDVARTIHAEELPTRVLALSAFDDPAYVRDLLQNGASGYMTKDKAAPFIVEAVVAVSRGEGRWFVQPQTEEESPLSDREMGVLKLLARGLSNADIADTLHLSEHTVRNHLTSVYAKLGLASSREAVAWAWEHGHVQGE